MPHITIEYSENLNGSESIPTLVERIHAAAIGTGAFPTGGVRTLALPSMCSRVGDGAPANGFVQIHVRIAPGRTVETRQAIIKALFEAARSVLKPVFAAGPFGLQIELSEFDPGMTLSQSNMM